MRLRTTLATIALAGAALGGIAADDATTIYFQMEGPCNEDPPRVLDLQQSEEYSGPCFPVVPGTVGQSGAVTDVYDSKKAVAGLQVNAGDAISGQFRFMNFFEAIGSPGPSVGMMDFEIVITARIGGQTVTLVEHTETNSPVAGTDKVFEFSGEAPRGGAILNLQATVTASGNTLLGMGYDHANSFFTIG